MLSECDEEIVCSKSPTGVTHLRYKSLFVYRGILLIYIFLFSIPRFKQRYSLVIPSLDNELAIMDTLKLSDTVLFLISAAAGIEFGSELIDEWGNGILTAAFAQVSNFLYVLWCP